MIDRSLLRRLRVTALGILGAIVSIELLRAAVSWYVHERAPSMLIPFSAIFSLIVLTVVVIRDEIVRLGASVGIACYPRDAQTAEELLRCADAAMYRAKHVGRNRLELYG
ncbi:MAG TPA: diguanylate cyclase [Candidatus Aquilonibacter sp.]